MTDSTSIKYDQFVSDYPAINYRAGYMLMTPDTELTHAFFLESGKVRKYSLTRYNEKATMNIFVAPSLLPISSVLNGTPNLYYFETMNPVVVRCIPVEEMATYIKDNPDVAYDLLQKVYAGLENTQRRIAYLMRGSLRCRVMFELVIELQRSGKLQHDGSYLITISETEIAERAGLSRETVSRELAKIFKLNDVCRRQGRSILIQSRDALEEMLQQYT